MQSDIGNINTTELASSKLREAGLRTTKWKRRLYQLILIPVPHLNVYALATGAASPGYTLVPRAGSPGFIFVPRASSPQYTPVIGLVALNA